MENSIKNFLRMKLLENESPVILRIDEVKEQVTAVISEDYLMQDDIIIGCDFINQDRVVLSKIDNTVEMKNKQTCNLISTAKLDQCPLNIGGISVVQKNQCIQLLNEYVDVISCKVKDLEKANLIEMQIRCTLHEPIVYNPYRMSMSEKQILADMMQELLECGIIREFNSPYTNPVILVKKKTGDYGAYIDFRKLNSVTIQDKYPLPLIEDQFEMRGQ